jgi:KaiC/GvpD/RAD55 family RecA-like ATPase
MIGERVPTGSEALDKVTEGGFPRGSLIILAGSPGSGKSLFGVNFILEGSRRGEKGVFASLTETRDSFIANTTKLIGHDYEEFTKAGASEFLELSATREGGAPVILQSVLQRVEELRGTRLVLDSFSRVSDLLKDKMESRITLQSAFQKLRSLKCTTVLTVDIPSGHLYGGTGVEEFIADGLIVLTRELIGERLLRRLEIVKLRGTRLARRELLFTLEGGFTAFSPFQAKTTQKRSRFEPTMDVPGKFSTGSAELDSVFEGGYPRGSTVLLEVDSTVASNQYRLVMDPTTTNFMSKGSAIISFPSMGFDYRMVREIKLVYGLKEEEIDRLLRVRVVRPSETPTSPIAFPIDGVDAEEDMKKITIIQDQVIEQTRKPFLSVFGWDSLMVYYGAESATRIANIQASRTNEKQGLCILILKAGYGVVSQRLAALANVHMRLTEKFGTVLLYGVKPRTNLYVLEMDASKGYPMPRLTPII